MGKEDHVRYEWLDRVMSRVGAAFSDRFTIAVGPKEEDDNEKHGKCFKCSYTAAFHKDLPPQLVALPHDQGIRIMKLIKHAARMERADPALVKTRINGQHDFADWGWVEDGVAEMWIYLERPKEKPKGRLHVDVG